jgi:hypothetical protein
MQWADTVLTLLMKMRPGVISPRQGPGNGKRPIQIEAWLKSKRLEALLVKIRKSFQG